MGDSRGKRTSERARICLPALLREARKSPAALMRGYSEPEHSRINAAGDLRLATLGLTRASRDSAAGDFRACSLACLFPSTVLEREERLLVV